MRFVKPPAAAPTGPEASPGLSPLPLQYSLGAEKARYSRYGHSRYGLGAEQARGERRTILTMTIPAMTVPILL